MRLSLLRGPTSPDPNCDMGTHRFSWAIYPHLGTYTESDVAQVAYAFNAPMRRKSSLVVTVRFVFYFECYSPILEGDYEPRFGACRSEYTFQGHRCAQCHA